MGQQFASVWYATPEKIVSMTKWIVFSDRGSLDLSPDRMQYRGRKFAISMPKVVAVSLTSQRIPWVTYALMNVAIVAYFAVMYANRFNPVAMAAILVTANLFGLLVAASTKWVMVEYEDEGG